MPVDRNAVGNTGCCTCGGGAFSFTFRLAGCKPTPNNPALFNGITVNVYTDSGMGTLLASGVTSGSGAVTLGWSGTPGTYYVTVPAFNARWIDYAANLNLTPSGGSGTISMPTNTAGGYSCCGGVGVNNIDIPLHGPLTMTDGSGNTYPLLWSSGCSSQHNFCSSGTASPITPACTGPGNIWIAFSIRENGANYLAIGIEWYVSFGQVTCYSDCTTGAQQGCTASGFYTIASIAIPLHFTIAMVPDGGNPGGSAPYPFGLSMTVTE